MGAWRWAPASESWGSRWQRSRGGLWETGRQRVPLPGQVRRPAGSRGWPGLRPGGGAGQALGEKGPQSPSTGGPGMGGSAELPGQREGPSRKEEGSPRWGGQRGLVPPTRGSGGRPRFVAQGLPSGNTGSRWTQQQAAGGLAPARQAAGRLRRAPRTAWRAKERPQWCPQRPGHLWKPVKGRRGAPKAPRPDPDAGIPGPRP